MSNFITDELVEKCRACFEGREITHYYGVGKDWDPHAFTDVDLRSTGINFVSLDLRVYVYKLLFPGNTDMDSFLGDIFERS